MISPEQQSKLSSIRMKIVDGSATMDDMKEGVFIMREARVSSAASSETSRRKKAIAAVPDANSLLDEMGG